MYEQFEIIGYAISKSGEECKFHINCDFSSSLSAYFC